MEDGVRSIGSRGDYLPEDLEEPSDVIFGVVKVW